MFSRALGRIPLRTVESFRSFLSSFKRLDGVAKGTVEEATALLRQVDTGIAAIDDTLKNVPITRSKQGFLRIGDETVGTVNKILRSGDLEALVRLGKRGINITAFDKQAFKELVAATPEKALSEVAEEAVRLKRLRPYMDSTVENLDLLSQPAKRDLAKVERNLYKYVKAGSLLTLTVGSVVVGVDWIKKATEKRRGCFMLTTINNKTTSCKVQEYSNIGEGGNFCKETLPYYNVTLVLMQLATLHDTDKRKIAVAEAADSRVEDFSKNLATLIDTKYTEMTKVVASMKDKPLINYKTLTHPDIEGGKVPDCRMCSPTANPISTEYIDSSQYADNITFQCVTNPSILDTIADVTLTTGKNLWQGVSSTIGGALKPIGILAVVVLVLVLIVTVVMRFMTRGGRGGSSVDSTTIAYYPLYR